MEKIKLENLLELIENKKYKQLNEILVNYNPVDISELLEELDTKEQAIIFRMIEKSKAAEVFSYLDIDYQKQLVKAFTDREISQIIELMYTDDSVDFLSEMPSNFVNRLLNYVDSETRHDINQLLKYPKDSAGSIMTVEYVSLKEEMTVKEALAEIKAKAINSETIYTCYVTERRKLLGIVSAKSLIINDENTLIKDIINRNFISVNTNDDKEDVANLFKKYGFIAIPVVDSENCMVGIVTIDDAIEVLHDETTEDMNKMAGITSDDRSYINKSVWDHAKHRIMWLLILMLSATITGTIIANYEHAFSAIPLLVAFIPMLMDTGGNCGSQSATLVIRGLTTGELSFSDIFKIIWKEFRVSIVVGIALALVNGIRMMFMYNDLQMAIVVSSSLAFTIVFAKFIGAILPLLADKAKLDPAIMASPLITTVVDAFSISIYFKIATTFFKL